jgi:uncharacterized protein YpmB
MKKTFFIILFVLVFAASLSEAGFLDNIMKNIGLSSQQGLDDKTVISGLKEALSVGTDKAVKEVSSIDGYLANQAIKILMPEKIQKVADTPGNVVFCRCNKGNDVRRCQRDPEWRRHSSNGLFQVKNIR